MCTYFSDHSTKWHAAGDNGLDTAAMTSECLRQRVERGLVRLVLCYIMFLGLLSLRYDFGTHRLRPSRALKIYSLAHNLTMLVLTPFSLMSSFDKWSWSQDTNILSQFANATNVVCRTLGLLLTLVLRRQCEPLLSELVQNLQSLQHVLDAESASTGSRLRYLLYLNVAIMWCHCVFLLIGTAQFLAAKPSLLNAGLSFYLYVMVNYIHVVVVQHAAFLCFFYERTAQLNARLEFLLRTASAGSDGSAAVLRLCRLHTQLMRHLQRFKDMFQPQVLCILVILFVNNAMTGYHFVKVLVGKREVLELAGFSYAISGLVYVLIFLAFYDYFVICARVANEVRRTGAILQQFLPQLEPPRLTRACEMFLLQLQRLPADTRICGMFAMNHRSAFLLTQQILLYTIILVQYDYHNI